MDASTCTPQIRVQTFGDFGIFYQGVKISAPIERAKKLMDLAEYLVMHHDRAVPKSELYEVLWPNEESGNPGNALKTLIHRFRTLLVQGGAPEDLEFIVVRQGTCQWNTALDYAADTAVFDRLYAQAVTPREGVGRSEQIDVLRRVVALYRGRFLNETELWMVASSTYYHSCFLRMVYQLCTLLREDGAAEEVVEVCRTALCIDALDETIHRALILALVATGRTQEAASHYNHITELYYSRLGVQVSEELRALYRDIAAAEQTINLDVDTVCGKLEEHDMTGGAFVCEYSIFRDLYRIEARCLSRYGGRVFLALVTVTDAYLQMPPLPTLTRAMEQLLEVIRGTLRKGDVMSRYSPAQYVILLPTVTYETGEKVLERIRRTFRRQHPKSPVVLTCKLRPLRPPEEGIEALPEPDWPAQG